MSAGPILVWGTGAIGGTIGAYLGRAGHDLLFVDTDADHVAAMNANGLAVEGPIDNFSVPAKAVVPADVRGTFERVFLCVKAHHTEKAMRQLAPHLATGGYVASFQNGLNELIISDVVGRERTVGAFINFGADYISPGLIHFGGRGAFVLGELDGRRSKRIEALHRDISAFEPNAIITDNIMGYLWGKLGYGALLFATALTDASIVDALGAEEAQPIHRQLACEAVAVAHALAVTPLGFNGYDPAAFAPRAAAGAACASFAAMVAHNAKSTKTHSGIWRDLAVRKRKTEVDAQLGPIVRFGRESGVPTPATQELIAMIHEIEDGVRSLAWENLAELALKARRQGEVDRIPASGSGGQLSIPPE
ncbi:MAG: ketopantoate reductase family protein [Methylobacteriaceae bacterium]|nr:ketopantoate reductase family protein [Methylobacteriaceae bacterium]